MFVLNSSRPLFRDNPQLRRAVNFALDRDTFVASAACTLTGSATFRPASRVHRQRTIYPLRRRSRPREGARGREPARRQGRLLRSRRSAGARLRPVRAGTAGGDRARRRDPAVRRARTASSYLGRLGIRTSRGTWRSCSGRRTTSIPPRTSTGSSTASSPAAPTSTGFDEPSFTELMRQGGAPAGRGPREGLRRARPAARPRRRTARCRSMSSTRRRSSRRGRPEVHAAAASARPDDGLPEALRRLHGHPDEPVGDDDAGGSVADLDRLHLSRPRVDAGDGPVAGVRDPDGAGAHGDRGRLRCRPGSRWRRSCPGRSSSRCRRLSLVTQAAPCPKAIPVDRRPTLVESIGPFRNVGGL